MPPLRQPMIAALQLRGTSARTHQSSVREVRLLAQCSHTSPDLLAAQHLPHSLRHRKNVDGLSPRSMRLCSSALRFFYPQVLGRDWHTVAIMRAETAQRLPTVLSRTEGQRLLQAMTPWHPRASCTTLSSGGERLPAALSPQGGALDGPRHMRHVPRGTGAQDRSSPLPNATLDRCRTSWQTHPNPTWLLPAPGRDHTPLARATSPRPRSSVHGAVRTATPRAGSRPRAVGPHPLRHASATPLLAAGVNRRALQRALGHAHLATTLLSLPLPPTGHADAVPRRTARMRGRASCSP
jgi:site-specific recombinase XerD